MRAILPWLALSLCSAVLCRASWTSLPRPDLPAPPAPLPRPPSALEREQVQRQLATLRAELTDASLALGRPVRTDELEGPLPVPAGRALPSGLPDNPLHPSVAAVLERCPPVEQQGDSADWIYCPAEGSIHAVGLAPYQVSGSE